VAAYLARALRWSNGCRINRNRRRHACLHCKQVRRGSRARL